MLAGYVWSYTQCRHVRHVAKTDDNVVLDLDKLLSYLDNLNTDQAETNIRLNIYMYIRGLVCLRRGSIETPLKDLKRTI